MKAEINNENKARFFALYWGQNCGVVLQDPREPVAKQLCIHGGVYDYLELKPLSQISDEDAIEVAILFNSYRLVSKRYEKEWKVSRIENGNIKVRLSNDHYDLEVMISLGGWVWSNDDSIPTNYKHSPSMFDFLRSRSYAISWMGLSVEEMVEAGWIKLTE